MSQGPAPALSCHLAADRGRQLQVQVRGIGAPTLVLLTGLGTPAGWWHTLGDDTEAILGLVTVTSRSWVRSSPAPAGW